MRCYCKYPTMWRNSRLVWNLKFLYRVNKHPSLVPVLRQMSPIHIFQICSLIISYHLYFGLPSSSFHHLWPQSYLYASLLSCVRHAQPILSLIWSPVTYDEGHNLRNRFVRHHFEGLSVDVRIILKLRAEKGGLRMWTGVNCVKYGQMLAYLDTIMKWSIWFVMLVECFCSIILLLAFFQCYYLDVTCFVSQYWLAAGRWGWGRGRNAGVLKQVVLHVHRSELGRVCSLV